MLSNKLILITNNMRITIFNKKEKSNYMTSDKVFAFKIFMFNKKFVIETHNLIRQWKCP